MRAASRWLVSATAAVVAVVVTGAAVFAADYTDSVSGVEVFSTSTVGVFVGQASGSLPGYWYAEVDHTVLAGDPQTATITGGSFDLATTIDQQSTLITGQFDSGSVVQTGGFTGCTDQTYAVTGHLAGVGPYGGSQIGTGAFSAVLTHFRRASHGTCTTYAATIAGSVDLSF
jgi:hypothetical protein